jgi:FkbM family methyltransferase
MALNRLLSRALERLYRYDGVRSAKDRIRPLKHLLFGKDDVYLVVDLITRARAGRRPVRVVLDVGAAWGDKAVTFLTAFPESTVHCFEPQRASRARLRRRVARFGGRAVIHEYGLYNENRTVDLRLCSYPDASSLLALPAPMRRDGKREVGAEAISVRRLDDCLDELGIAAVDLLKIDVEGVEREVLDGARRALGIVENVFVEISPLRRGPRSGDHIAVFRLLHDAGFTLMGQYGDYWFSRDPDVIRRWFEE